MVYDRKDHLNMKNTASSPELTMPHHFGKWLGEVLGGPIPEETEATCSDCSMCKPMVDLTLSDRRFNLETKCCTYFPYLPNFLVGKIFLDEDPAFAIGRSAFLKVYHEGSAVITPLGVDPPPSYEQRYSPNMPGFGKQLEMRCPYYLNEAGGLCGIWKYRNSKCATWFCRYVKGQVGFEFWTSVDQLLSVIQKGLSRWCMRSLDTLPSWQQQTWGKWLGRQVEYFQECTRLVDSLHWHDLKAIVGDEFGNLADATQTAYLKLTDNRIPAVLRVGSYSRINLNEVRCRIWSYNRLHPLDLPRGIADSLHYFDGRPPQQVLQTIFAEKGVEIDQLTLQKLFDYRILVEAE